MKEESDGLATNEEAARSGIASFKEPTIASFQNHGSIADHEKDRLLTVDEVAERLNVTKDWVWDHSSRKSPFLPVIRIGDSTLRYRASKIEEFINEREHLSSLRRKRR